MRFLQVVDFLNRKRSFFLLLVCTTLTHTAQAQQTPIDDLEFADQELQQCIQQESRRSDYAEQLRYLTCARYNITDLQGIQQLTNLESLRVRSDNVVTVANIAAINELSSLRSLDFLNYANSSASFAQIDPTKVPLESISLLTTPNINDSILEWLYSFSELTSLVIGDAPVTETPQPSQLPKLNNLSIRNTPIRPNDVVAQWGDSNLTGLSVGGYGDDQPSFDTASWQLPSTLTYLMLRDGRLDSLQSLAQTLEDNNVQLEQIVLGVQSDDWSTLGNYADRFPSITWLDVGFSNFDDFDQISRFSGMERVYVDRTKDAEGVEPILTMLSNSPDIWVVSMGNVSYLNCDDRALLDNSGYSSLYLSYFGDACRTSDYQFRLLDVPEEYGAIASADSIEAQRAFGARTTTKGDEVRLEVLPKYDESWDEQTLRVVFDNGAVGDYFLRYPQPKTEPVRIADINFPDGELAECVEYSQKLDMNTELNDGEIPEYAHEMEYLLCDAFNGFYVNNLSGLEHFTNLSAIQMLGEQEEINDVSSLLPLKRLKWLTLSNKGLTDETMDVLRDYQSVAREWDNLHFGDNQLSDESLFDQWINGAKPGQVILRNNNYTGLPEWLSEADFSGSLTASGLPLADIQAELTQLTNSMIDQLYLDSVGIDSVAELVFPDSLTLLDLSDNGLTSMEGFTAPFNLTSLSLDNNPGIELSTLAGLETLSFLGAVNSEITSLNIIKQLPNLSYIDLSNNDITDLSPIEGFTREEAYTLYLSMNPASDYRPAIDKPWLTVFSRGNGQVACSEFYALESSSTDIWWDVCQQEDGKIRVNPINLYGEEPTVSLADNSQRYGQVEWLDGALNFTPRPGVEGWVELVVIVTYADGSTQDITLQVYIEPGSNPATANGIPIVILVSGQDSRPDHNEQK